MYSREPDFAGLILHCIRRSFTSHLTQYSRTCCTGEDRVRSVHAFSYVNIGGAMDGADVAEGNLSGVAYKQVAKQWGLKLC